ncbi:CheA signal transduction histidine kinase [Methylophilus rhizosphaerae]|uniref:Chemotaxis protein CheA n=1 Tax=Methylophilus rhizosphaerae TaxID=492660 RepID=A0A1G9AS41_9PROT|nr:chemotaxis protein CheA [Methylophilus rhizosphaerae]SDK30051.1 CheA signal transduction histidine kinase [Methylophilus rhizosphaerae]
MTVDMSQFYEVFFDEAEELLAEAERLLLGIDVAAPDVEQLNAIFRAAHSIKGGAATFGFMDMAEITHVLENLLDKIRKQEMALTNEHVDAFLAAKDVIKMQLDGHRHGSDVDAEQVNDISATLKALSEGQAAVPVEAAPAATAPQASQDTAAQVSALTVSADEQAKGIQLYDVGLPEVTEKDLSNLKDELALLGEVADYQRADNRHALLVKTDSSADDIVSICSFIVDPDALVIQVSGTAPATEAVAAVAPAAPEETAAAPADPGYGFFDNGQAGKPEENSSGKPAVAEEMGYGLFATDGQDQQEEGYGFFAPFKPHPDAPKAQMIGDENAAAALSKATADTAATVPADAPAAPREERRAQARRESDKPSAQNTESSSIRVGIEKVDQLINLVGELVITQAMIEQRVNALDPVENEALINSVSQLTRNTRDLQESVMSIRMMPMDFVFSRFPRMVRDLAGKLGKKVEFVTNGASTELDKSLIERIVDPLTHLVRNSVDHGIEKPEIRRELGKSEIGTLTLSAAHKGGSIVIEVTDDGGGLNRDKILAKAASNGLPVSESMSDTEVFSLIFAPGFSTAEVVTDVSGRGVGMDVVKRNITAMGGNIEIRSALGYGTTISISLPLTLAILDGMSVSLDKSIYVVPLNLIIETLQPRAEDLKTVTGEGLMVHVRGEYLPIIALHALFNHPTEITDPTEGVLLILEADGKKSALFVDRLVGQQQVVIKSLETNFKRIPGVSGATIMGDGSVALILDVPAITQMGQTTNYVTGGSAFANQNYSNLKNHINA